VHDSWRGMFLTRHRNFARYHRRHRTA